ncbi:helix-turn-helix domain-containing protein [Paenibacillus sp. GCM10012307]|uniref:Helix-turn-helix domain-containing protein n=1 Tax=Paenibacillus roseus TaxID=2798579 RepID=A0A934J5J9_9BACL|nr:helix-turn-helix domain-containing protein [Paenibacillus roseus]MBJ6361191.1 helix-turn-helix domain-containing protein [Paenibacillus roseus]
MSALWDAAKLADFLGVSPSTVYAGVREAGPGRIPHVKVRGRILFQQEKVVEWLENQPSNKIPTGARENEKGEIVQ